MNLCVKISNQFPFQGGRLFVGSAYQLFLCLGQALIRKALNRSITASIFSFASCLDHLFESNSSQYWQRNHSNIGVRILNQGISQILWVFAVLGKKQKLSNKFIDIFHVSMYTKYHIQTAVCSPLLLMLRLACHGIQM